MRHHRTTKDKIRLMALWLCVCWGLGVLWMACAPPAPPCCEQPAADGSDRESGGQRDGAEGRGSDLLPADGRGSDLQATEQPAGADGSDGAGGSDGADGGPQESQPDAVAEQPSPDLSPPEQPPVPESHIEQPTCAPGQQPTAEVCDGKDNDCDGQTDEDVVGCVGTLAGTGRQGGADGRGMQASFRSPSALAVGPQGHLYIADTDNHVIRKLDRSTNQVQTYAGTGQPGLKDGPLHQAQFHKPGALAIAANGDIYVADTVNHAVRKIGASDGQVTTIAGGQPGLKDGQGKAARFYFPSGIAYDGRGTLYVADTLNHCIRKIAPSGDVTVFAGSCEQGFANGRGKTAQFYFPIAIARSHKDDIYVADGSNNMIRKISPAGVVSVWAGEGNRGYRDGTAGYARFYYPPGVTVAADGSVYVADASNQRIRKIAPDGQVTTVAGAGPSGRRDGPAQSALFFGPTGIVAAHDRLYIADFNSHTIRMLRLR